jgi:hypothetical protein
MPTGGPAQKEKNMKTKLLTLLTVVTLGIAASARATMFGDPLVERAYASDFPVGQGQSAPVMVIPSAVLPTGTLDGFATWDQVDPGGSPFPSAGNTLTAYILRPTGNPNQFTEVFNSGLLTIPPVSSSQVATFLVSPFQTHAGDIIAFYGQGVPVDITSAGTDILIYPAGSPPGLNATFTLGTPEFPIYPQSRLYSFDAIVTPVPEASTVVAGALMLLPFGVSTLRIMRKNILA